MQINLTGFFEGKTQEFLLNLWKLLLSAQGSVGGIPASFLEAKKEQIRQQQASVCVIACVNHSYSFFK
jgi:serine/arginine repetitive matrix protein 1